MSEYDFLKDEENIKLLGKISNLVDSQLPQFVRDEGGNFSEFLKFYYKWMEAHELTIKEIVQDEFFVTLESEQGAFVLEDGSNLNLEGPRTDSSAYEKDEVITGLTSGAIGIVDRNSNTTSYKIYVTGETKTDFEPGELIQGTNNRTKGTVVSFYKNPVYASRTLLKSRDIDSVSTSMLDNFTKEFLVNLPISLSSDKGLLIKHIADVYRSKGTSTSYEFLFKSLYDIQNLTYYTPKLDLLKPSSGDWQQDKSIRIITDDPMSAFESHIVTGKQSGATGIVNRIEKFAAGVFNVTELFLTNITGTFVVGETVTSNEVEGVSGSGVTQGLLQSIRISGAGSNYRIDDKLTFSGGGGVEAKGKVTTVGSGSLTDFTIYDGGDGYVEDKALTVNNFATLGEGFAGKIKDVVDTFTFSQNEDIIGNFTSVVLNDLAFEMSGNTDSNVSDRLIDTLGFSKLDAGHIRTVQTTGTGSGYEAIPKISVVETSTAQFTENSVQILNLNSDPDALATTNAITDFFDPGEKIYANSGNKIGTFFGTVATEDTIKDPTRMRVKTIKFLDTLVTQKIPTAQRNDMLVNNSSYLGSSYPSVYHLQFVSGGASTVNTIKYRRGIDARELFNSANNNSKCDWYPTSGGVDVTGGYQTLSFGITGLTRDSSTATAITYGAHGLSNGQILAVSGANQTEYNGNATITVANSTAFTYTVSGSPASPATGTVTYNENVSVKFTLPFSHTTDDEYAFSTVDFISNEEVTGANSGAIASVNTGVAFSPGGELGNNSVIGVSAEDAGSGSIKSVLIQDVGVGFTSSPQITLPGLGANNATLNAVIGAVSSGTGVYLDENGQLSSSKKIIDSDFYQDYSYSLIANKQLNDYQEIIFKLLHPVGTKLFGEFTPDAVELNMGFDSRISFEGGDKALKEDGDDLLMEDSTDPKHKIVFNDNQNLSLGTVTITGNSDIMLGVANAYMISEASETLVTENNEKLALSNPIATDFRTTYQEGDQVIVDNEQSFEVSYGELRLEKYMTGTVASTSANVISIIGLKSPKTMTVPATFSANANFVANSVVTQISAETGGQIQGIVLRHELDDSNNNVLILHSCNGQFDTTSNANSTTGNTAAIDIDTYNLILEGTTGDLIGDLVLEEDGTSIIGLQDSIYRNNEAVTTCSFDYVKSNAIFGVGTDFQADFRIDDRIKVISTSEETKVLEIINSSCLIANTPISTDTEFNFILEDGNNFITSSGETVVLNELDPVAVKFDNEDIQHYQMHEPTVRGTTNVNGRFTGNVSLVASNSYFSIDLMVDDVISLSSNTAERAKILTIDGSTLTLNRALGDGTNNQSITLHSLRNFDLERSEGTISLSNPYDGSNNFLNCTINSTATGLLLLEDGIGTSNAAYVGIRSNEGKFKFETLASFENQIPKYIQT